jgi:hypothetical protein
LSYVANSAHLGISVTEVHDIRSMRKEKHAERLPVVTKPLMESSNVSRLNSSLFGFLAAKNEVGSLLPSESVPIAEYVKPVLSFIGFVVLLLFIKFKYCGSSSRRELASHRQAFKRIAY